MHSFSSLIHRAISNCRLNTSLPWCLHPSPINLVFYKRSKKVSLFEDGFQLRCIQLLSIGA